MHANNNAADLATIARQCDWFHNRSFWDGEIRKLRRARQTALNGFSLHQGLARERDPNAHWEIIRTAAAVGRTWDSERHAQEIAGEAQEIIDNPRQHWE